MESANFPFSLSPKIRLLALYVASEIQREDISSWKRQTFTCWTQPRLSSCFVTLSCGLGLLVETLTSK